MTNSKPPIWMIKWLFHIKWDESVIQIQLLSFSFVDEGELCIIVEIATDSLMGRARNLRDFRLHFIFSRRLFCSLPYIKFVTKYRFANSIWTIYISRLIAYYAHIFLSLLTGYYNHVEHQRIWVKYELNPVQILRYTDKIINMM